MLMPYFKKSFGHFNPVALEMAKTQQVFAILVQ